MKNIFIKLFLGIKKKNQRHLVRLFVITARCRWRACAAPSGSSAACRCVWISATCLCTERFVPGSVTATCQTESQSVPLKHIPAWFNEFSKILTFSLLCSCNTSPLKTVNKRKDVPSKRAYINLIATHLATTSSLWRSSADTLSGSSFLISTKSSSTAWGHQKKMADFSLKTGLPSTSKNN